MLQPCFSVQCRCVITTCSNMLKCIWPLRQYNELALVLWQRSPNCLYSGHTLWNLGFEPTELAPEWLLETDQFRI
jgi:hypothetical protein